MDDRIRIFFLILGGAVGFGLVGALFGGLARVLFQASGKASGGAIGATVVGALEAIAGRAFGDRARSAISGGSEGACFLGVLGGLLGAYVGYAAGTQANLLLDVFLATSLLALAAALFGVTGYLLARTGPRVVGLLCVGALSGALVGTRFAGNDGLILGTLAGGFVGICVALAYPRPPDEQ